MAASAKQVIPHSSLITLIGELVERAAVITPGATEWPKVGCRVMVKHNPDQATVFNIVSIGPVAEAMMQMKRGRTVRVVGQLKAATGAVEVFATEFVRAAPPTEGRRMMYLSPFMGDMFGGGTPKVEEDEDEDDDR
jgi:hypothetical protein